MQSACVLCSYGCALDIGVKNNKIVGVRGRGHDRVNHGRLGPKGLHGWIANNSQERLTTPLIRCNGKLQPASWDEAMSLIVQQSKDILTHHDRNAIAFYNSGQLFLEEYYTLGVIGKAGIGTRNMDANTRLCTATASFALRESFGTDGQPGSYRDFDTTDAIRLCCKKALRTNATLRENLVMQLLQKFDTQILLVPEHPLVQHLELVLS